MGEVVRTCSKLLVVVLFLGCSGAKHVVERDADSSNAVITFDCPVADAEVWVDDRYFQGALARGVAIAPGTYRIEIRHDGYHTFYAEVTVTKRERRVLEVRLAEILP